MEEYRRAAAARYRKAKEAESKKAKDEAKRALASDGDTAPQSGFRGDAKRPAPNPSPDIEPSPDTSAPKGGMGGAPDAVVFVRLLGDRSTVVSVAYDGKQSMADFMKSVAEKLPSIDLTAPTVFRSTRVWPPELLDAPSGLESKHAKRFAKISLRDEGGKAKVTRALGVVDAKIAEISAERREQGVADLKSRHMRDLQKLKRYFENLLHGTLESLGIVPEGMLICQTKESAYKVRALRAADEDKAVAATGDSSELKDSGPFAYKRLHKSSAAELEQGYLDVFRALFAISKRSRISQHQEVYDLDRAVEFTCSTLARTMLRVSTTYRGFRPVLYVPLLQARKHALEASKLVEKVNKLSPFDWMNDTKLHDELKTRGKALAEAVQEVVRVASMAHPRCVWQKRMLTFLMGLHKRAGGGMLRWCRLATHFDPMLFGHAFEMVYPVKENVTPKIFSIPFIRDYRAVMAMYGLPDTKDEDLVIPVMTEAQHDQV